MRLLTYIIVLFLAVGCAVAEHKEPRIVAGDIDCLRPAASDIDQYVSFLRGKRIGMVVNASSRVGQTHLVDTLISLGVDVRKIFAPEHGFRGDADAGQKLNDQTDAQTGLPIVSLYGRNKKPSQAQLADIDLVLYDLQDVGVRFYTYISTLHYVMEACAEAGKTVLVLDRPNPNGRIVDGPVRQSDCKSFVGLDELPILYGMTAGELACMMCGEGWLNAKGKICDLKVAWAKQDSVNCLVDENGDFLFPPSPNLKSLHAVRLYPSLCFFEATSVSVGRGTDSPFELIGAPQKSLGNFEFTPHSTVGASNPLHKDDICYGEDLRGVAPPDSIDLSYLIEYRQKLDSSFWTNERFFDLLAGTKILRQQIEAGLSADSIRSTWQADLNKFKAKRAKYLYYNRQEKKSDFVKGHIPSLIWAHLPGNASEAQIDELCETIRKYHIGGVLLMQTSLYDVANIVERLRAAAGNYPLLIAVDGENGLGMRFSDVIKFPKNEVIGQLQDTTLIYEYGRMIGRQLRACGVDVNFAPVVDVNTNPQNPVIGARSFSADPDRVALFGSLVMRGMQDEGIIAVAKHFPGHGDTHVDSHVGLPVIPHSRARLDTVELIPFRRLIADGVMGIMSAHLVVPALDSSGAAASMSSLMLDSLLRREMGFEGLIISDALNMQGALTASRGRNPERTALLAGNDIAEFSVDIPAAVEALKADSALLQEKLARYEKAALWAPQSRAFGWPPAVADGLEMYLFANKLK